jgi:hypothetical protein
VISVMGDEVPLWHAAMSTNAATTILIVLTLRRGSYAVNRTWAGSR